VAAIQAALSDRMVAVDAVLPYDRGELVARARHSGDVEERYLATGVHLRGRLPPGLAAEVGAARGRRRRNAGAA
jgi:GTP-binding protein HflX